LSGTCEATIASGALPPAEALSASWGCPRPASVTLRAACVHEHVKVKRMCAEHGQVNPPGARQLCKECAGHGHDCPVMIEVVTP
jgi:hypothetical protein